MFKDWGFLVTEMISLIIVAALLGLLVGWIIWGWRNTAAADTGSQGDRSDVLALEHALKQCRSSVAQQEAHIDRLQTELESTTALPPLSEMTTSMIDIGSITDDDSSHQTDHAEQDSDRSRPADISEMLNTGPVASSDEGIRPVALHKPRNGQPDDLEKIRGIGPTLEAMCHELGFYHFDQIASWTEQEVAWVDANLPGFKGRVSRDRWVEQAQVLAEGGETGFSRRRGPDPS